MTLANVGIIVSLGATGLGFVGIGLTLARMWGRFEARFDGLDRTVGEIQGTLANAMKRMGDAERDLGIVMDRTRRRTGESSDR